MANRQSCPSSVQNLSYSLQCYKMIFFSPIPTFTPALLIQVYRDRDKSQHLAAIPWCPAVPHSDSLLPCPLRSIRSHTPVSGPLLCPLEMSNTSRALWDTTDHEDEGLRTATRVLFEGAPEAAWLLCTQ